MTNASEFIDATPSAALLIESIRDIGYSLETAIADLVDIRYQQEQKISKFY